MADRHSLMVDKATHDLALELAQAEAAETGRYVSVATMINRALRTLQDNPDVVEQEVVKAIVGTMRAFFPGVEVRVLIDRHTGIIQVITPGDSQVLWAQESARIVDKAAS